MTQSPPPAIVVPFAEGPERAVLSVMLARPATYLARAATDGLTAAHFHLPAHAALFDAVMAGRRFAVGDSFDLSGFVAHLSDTALLQSVGGPAAVYKVYTYAANDAHWDAHVAVLRDRLARRLALAAALEATQVAQDDAASAQRMLETAARSVRDALQPPAAILDANAAGERFVDEVERRYRAGETPGLPTGLRQLDLLTGGLKRGEMWVVSGPTSSGKSVLLTQVASHAAIQHNARVLVVSLEMNTAELVARVLACNWTIRMESLVNPAKAHPADLVRIRDAVVAFSSCTLALLADDQVADDGDSLTMRSIEGYARLHAQTGLDLLVVDYLQLVSGTRNKGDSREQEVAGVSRRLKRLARTLDCPVLTASQLNDDGKLRESRAIGQDADVVLSLVEEGLKVLKNRNAPRGGLLALNPNFQFQRFESAEQT